MMKTIQLTAFTCLLAFALVMGSCKKEKADKTNPQVVTTGFDVARIWDCHKSNNPFPSQINKNLEGSWVWLSSACFFTGKETFAADKQVNVLFKDAGNYQVFENGALESEGSWKLSQAGEDSWTIITSSPSNYLHGYVLLCDNELVFYNSYIDGCDLYFVRNK